MEERLGKLLEGLRGQQLPDVFQQRLRSILSPWWGGPQNDQPENRMVPQQQDETDSETQELLPQSLDERAWCDVPVALDSGLEVRSRFLDGATPALLTAWLLLGCPAERKRRRDASAESVLPRVLVSRDAEP